ncbi:hypothetical protein HPB52_012301 [Rhipicephalus sanguineus]|uniref:Uncharacterized protein n=1 Tax=Rhipicephalus sanguineus TaxID=34632 RepID=A0A9D4T9V8_RHISA|nr:hypothetical protein HPB52_012301 [Rhipicephalus sanguineus]
MRRYKVIETSEKGVQMVIDASKRRVFSSGQWRCGMGPRVGRHSISHFCERVEWDITCSRKD